MRKILLLVILNLFGIIYMMAATDIVYMNVGDTRTLSFNAPPYLDGCNWSISRPDDIIFVTHPGRVSTSVTIKAVHPLTAIDRCIVHCQYYYKELDPTTGRFIYSRTGYYDWEIIVNGNNDNDDHGSGSGNAYIKLNKSILTAEQDTWAGILYPLNYNGPQIEWECNDDIVFLLAAGYSGKYPKDAVEVKGLAIGRTKICCTNQSGGRDVCELNILPRNSYEIGEIIKYCINDVVLNFDVTSNLPKQCTIINVWQTKVSPYFIVPEEVANYSVTEIGKYAFQKNPYIKTVVLPSNLTYIGEDGFQKCSELESILFPSSLRVIDKYAFWYSNKLCNVIFNEGLQTIEESAFQGTSINQIYLQDGLKSIGKMAFYQTPCVELVIPSSVQQIGNYAFYANNGHSYKSIISKISYPFEIDETVFNQLTYDNAVLYVPEDQINLYENLNGWRNFKHIKGFSIFSSIDQIHIDDTEEFFNMQGQRVMKPLNGEIYIRKKGLRIDKIVFSR